MFFFGLIYFREVHSEKPLKMSITPNIATNHNCNKSQLQERLEIKLRKKRLEKEIAEIRLKIQQLS